MDIKEQIRIELIGIARTGRTITYLKLGQKYGFDIAGDFHAEAKRLSDLLGEISEEEHHAGRPLLSTVVVRDDSQMPGDGFFKFAKALGKLRSYSSEWQREEFFIKEMKMLQLTWSPKARVKIIPSKRK